MHHDFVGTLKVVIKYMKCALGIERQRIYVVCINISCAVLGVRLRRAIVDLHYLIHNAIVAECSYEEPRKRKKKEKNQPPTSARKKGTGFANVLRDADKADAAFKSKDKFILRNELF